MTRKLKIAELGNPVLRSPTSPIESVTDPTIQTLIDALIEKAIETNGVGIAAPQVSARLRLFIVASRPTIRYLHAPVMPPTPMINPEILTFSEEKEMGWEGCLSVPGLRGNVERAREIEVRYLDREGQLQQEVFTGFVARIIQHEFDHINGKVFLDRVASTHDLMSEAEYHTRIVCS